METKKYKHMTLDDRIEIQECLHKGMSFKDIGKRIGKDQTTISKEVKLHAKVQVNGFTKTDEMCPKLLKAPFVCNGCSKLRLCVTDAASAATQVVIILAESILRTLHKRNTREKYGLTKMEVLPMVEITL